LKFTSSKVPKRVCFLLQSAEGLSEVNDFLIILETNDTEILSSF